MSYTHGIGSPQQIPVASEAIASQSTSRVGKSESASSSVSPQNRSINTPHLDQTTLSSASGLIATALSGSDVRPEKVAALQRSIAAGNYNVPSSDVASKMINALLN